MLKIFVRILCILVSFASTASAAQSLDSVFESVQEQIDFSKVDTGFETSKDQYTFGAKRTIDEIDQDLSFNIGVGAKYKRSQEYNLSSPYRAQDSQTNSIEDRFNPISASPMLGASIGYKF